MAKDKFLQGAMILTAAGLMVKVIGSVNRILLSRLLGGEGIGLYQMAYPVYLLLLSLSAAGIPVAISIIISGYLAREDYVGVRKVFHTSLVMMTGVGLLLAGALVLGAGWLIDSGVMKDGRVYYALLALAPPIVFGTMLASFKGFFQGHQLMMAPAISQITEQFIRVVTMLILAYVLLPYGLEFSAAGAAAGALPGSVAGLIVMAWFYRKYRHLWIEKAKEQRTNLETEINSWQLMKQLLMLALPVSCANILVPVTSSIDAMLVPKYLIESGIATREATTLYGYLAGMAQPLILMATIPTVSLATSLVPAISEAFVLQQKEVIQQKAAMAMKLCCLIVFPAAVGMACLAEPLSRLLYGTSKAGVAIMFAAPAIAFLGIQQVTTGMLQGMHHSSLPMLTMLSGIAAKLLVIGTFTTAYGVAGAAMATNLNFALTALLNIFALYRYQITFDKLVLLKIAVASAIMGAAANVTHASLHAVIGPLFATVLALGVAVVVYAGLIFVTKIINHDEMRHLPILKKFVK